MLKYAMTNAFRRGEIAVLAIAGVGLETALMTVLLSVYAGVTAQAPFAGSSLAMVDHLLLAASITSAAAGVLTILIIMLMSVSERRREFGILKAAGWSSANVVTAIGIEALTLAVFGVGSGYVLGSWAIAILRRFLGVELVTITTGLVIEVAIFGLLAGLLGGLYAGFRAAGARPIDALRGE
ncbi:MAG: ABC transporter permease [Chloroflexi bacterium]|nr:ABC transporter permease [Chloroflexota bacterium]